MKSSLNLRSTEPPESPVVLLFGPTGVGKTAVLETLSPGTFEVVSADSMQVYRGMDIGTAKPAAELLHRLPHHLIDICDPSEQFHLGEFVRLADKAVKEILARGSVPIISGGTAYYFKHFLYGLPAVPPGDPDQRHEIEAEAKQVGNTEMLRRLAEVDPPSAARISENDRYRIVRALEVFRTAGRPLSSFPPPTTLRPGLKPLIIGLSRPREELYRRIDRRVEEMIRQGLAAEVEKLRTQGYTCSDPGMRAIGYREFCVNPSDSGHSIEKIVTAIQTNSRRYAKRQLTFFRAIEGTIWVDPDNTDEVRRLIYSFCRRAAGSSG